MFYYLFISLIGSSWPYSACAIMVKLLIRNTSAKE